MNGASVLISVRTAVGPPEVFTVVGSQRDATISESVASIDASSKDQPEARVDAGRYSSSVSLAEVYVPTDAAFVVLKAAFRARTKVKLQVAESGVAKETCMAVITKMDKNFPDQDVSTVSMDFDVDGAWTVLP